MHATLKALSTLSQKSATVAENGETTAKFGDCRTFLRQSYFCAIVSPFCNRDMHQKCLWSGLLTGRRCRRGAFDPPPDRLGRRTPSSHLTSMHTASQSGSLWCFTS